MTDDKINISWEELKTSKVEKQVKQQQAMARNRRYSELTTDDLPFSVVARSSIWSNKVVILSLFGLFGGMLGWAALAALYLNPDQKTQADVVMGYIRDIRTTEKNTPEAEAAVENLLIDTGKNPFLDIERNDSLSAAVKQTEINRLSSAQRWRGEITHFIGYGICGMAISICLSVAEPLTNRNLPASVVNGSLGAAVGLLGGFSASLVIVWLGWALGDTGQGRWSETLEQAASWGTLGCFTAIAPGIIARNWKRLAIGVGAGLAGGVVGGILMVALTHAAGNDDLGKLAALCSIGLVTGAATGLIELAARTGWLKVTAGFIRGKQFILYRNPTFIGSAPDCQIYLFRDLAVGRRHASLHLLKGRVELENLPLGGDTLVNGSKVSRRVLRDGDEIKIGVTTFQFQMRENANQ